MDRISVPRPIASTAAGTRAAGAWQRPTHSRAAVPGGRASNGSAANGEGAASAFTRRRRYVRGRDPRGSHGRAALSNVKIAGIASPRGFVEHKCSFARRYRNGEARTR